MTAGRTSISAGLHADDVRLLRALQLDPRASFATLGAALGLAETTVRRRYLRLRADGVVRVVGVVDTGVLGQSRWLLRLRCRLGSGPALADALAARDDVSWVAISAAGSEVVCWVRSRTAEQREDLLGRRLPRTAEVQGVEAAVMLHQYVGGRAHYRAVLDGVLTTAEEAALRPGTLFTEAPVVSPGTAELTDADTRLLEALTHDGRAGLVDLAAATDLTPGRVSRRLDRLLRDGVVHLDVEIAPAALGLHARAYLWLRVHPGSLRDAGRALADHPEVAFAAATSGTDKLHAVALCRDHDALYELTSDRLGALPGLTGLEVWPLLRQVKQSSTRVRDDRLVPVEPGAEAPRSR